MALLGNSKKVNKGAPSGIIVSLIIHAVAFFIAGLFVVFTVVNRPEPEFEPPPAIERPKMKLKKPKVKVKKSSQPKPSSRIVAKVKTREMPEIQLPDLMGTGEGLMGGTGLGGEFLDMPEIGEITVFGGGFTTGNDMEVTFYSLTRDRQGQERHMDYRTFYKEIADFVDAGWDRNRLSKYYRSARKLFATTIMIPFTSSSLGPAAFGEDMDYGYCWIALYKGKLVHKDGITFRFWGGSDDLLVVRVDGKLVLVANIEIDGNQASGNGEQWVGAEWSSSAPGNRAYWLANSLMAGGDWITLEPGVPLDFEAMVGEGPGGEFYAGLLVEVKGEDYPLNDRGTPIFPIFAMEEPSWELQDTILEYIWDGDANVTNVSPIFNDFYSEEKEVVLNPRLEKESAESSSEAAPKAEMRTWTSTTGKTVEGRYFALNFDNVVVEDAAGTHTKLPWYMLCEEDRNYVELLNPPELSVDALTSIQEFPVKSSPIWYDNSPIKVFDHQFGARIKQLGTGDYDHELTVEMYVLSQQVWDMNKFRLIARLESEPFKLTKENDRRFEYQDPKTIRLVRIYIDQGDAGQGFGFHRGQKYHGCLILVRDERGEIIAYKAQKNWMYDNLDKLMKLPVGAWLDDKCNRTHPSSPPPYRLHYMPAEY